MEKWVKPKTIPMDTEWKDRLFYMINDRVSGNKQLQELRKRLISYGGEEVCLPALEPDLKAILKRGYIRKGTSKLMRGQPCQCHMNSATLWEDNQGRAKIVTGYALSKDGVWRCHSWVIDTLNDKLIETTEKRVAYYGFELTKKESELFREENF